MSAAASAAGNPAGPDPIRRVLFFGKSMSRTRCTGALVDALREHGLHVRWRNMATLRRWLGRELSQQWARAEFRRYQPDLVFVFFRDLPQQLLAEFSATARTVVWCEEALDDMDNSVVDYFRHADVVCMSNPSHFPWLREHGMDNMLFQMSGFSRRFHRPTKPRSPVRDVAFIGGPGRKGQRAAFLARISERFQTDVFGAHWERWHKHYPSLRIHRPVDHRGYAKICATSRVMLGVNEVNDNLFYFSNRTWLTLACGGFHLTHYVPGLDSVFEAGEHLAWFHDEDEAFRLLEHYVPRDSERARIAAGGHALAMGHHTYYHRVSRILRALREGVTPSIDDPRLLLAQERGPQGVLANADDHA